MGVGCEKHLQLGIYGIYSVVIPGKDAANNFGKGAINFGVKAGVRFCK